MQALIDWHFDEISVLIRTETFNAVNLFDQFKALAGEGAFDDINLLVKVSLKLTEAFPSHQNLILQAWTLCLKDSFHNLNATAFVILQQLPAEPIANELVRDWKTLGEEQKTRFLSLLAFQKFNFPNLKDLILNEIDAAGADFVQAALQYLASISAFREIFMSKIQKFYENGDDNFRLNLMFAFSMTDELSPCGISLFRRAFQEIPVEHHNEILRALAEIKLPQADIVDLLLSLTSSKDLEFQADLAQAFSGHVDFSDKVQSQLIEYLSSPAARVRENAIFSLSYIERYRVDLHEPIYLCLTDENKDVRTLAFRTLWNYEDQNEMLRKIVESLTKHPLESIQEFAHQCLAELKRVG